MTEQIGSSLEADAIDGLLRGLRVSSTVFCQATFTAPWGLGVPARGLPAFHVVAAGGCWLEVEGSRPRQLNPGDLVILPQGDVHWLRDAPGSSGVWLDDLVARRLRPPHPRVLVEDPLRTLRGVRLEATLGFRLTAPTLRAIGRTEAGSLSP